MIRVIRASLFYGLFCVATASHAQQISGNELLETCKSENQVMAGFCIGYIIGYSEGAPWGATLAIVQATEDADTDRLNKLASFATGSCVPSEASNEQLRDVVIKHMQNNPETRHTSARTLIWTAYSEAFPCE
ncbi:Rap1a/Tai family immunity protein [uncultured Roseovarius sp.]|uniref:Rap1a/Tai family immunity protein n=1 Tax=uncultured Roseovarius sp. TaxID=293344 RepID=UPI0025D3D564|nr:Rap1a/Tai family immunity protein [uncultured Roseovarius sp.]